MKKSIDDDNLGDNLVRQARLKGLWGCYEKELDEDVPVVHSIICGGLGPDHQVSLECWCIPELEFRTEFVAVYRHRRVQ